ncbi:restriction endonuclease subunit S [Streptococcus parasanguinis]|nr:restriction endonuclease subunit S [Streptococcus parasanguinis]
MIKNSIPQIRFKGFDVVWVENRITDIVKVSAGGDVDKEKLKENGKYPVIANALTNKGIVGYYDDYKVKAPAVTVTGRGDVGYAVARHENFTPVVRLLTLQSDSIDVDYLENQINSMKILNESTGVPQLTAPQLGNYKVYHPEIDEQSAIGSLFRILDDLLASYKDNLTNYQSLKATMLSEMFPKAGQTVPEIRLDGFEGEWKKVKLKDVTESIEYGLNASAKEFDGENKYIRITDIDDVSRKFKEDSLTSPDINVSECDNYLLCEKDILFARTGASVGKTYLYDIKDGKVYFAGFLIRARIKEKFDSKFIFQNTLTNRFTQYVKVTSQRSGQPGVNGKEYGEYGLYLPKYEEQQAIGSYFSNLDNLINSHQEKISQLETLKKKLLQDMFI